jgi:hypothetical protein
MRSEIEHMQLVRFSLLIFGNAQWSSPALAYLKLGDNPHSKQGAQICPPIPQLEAATTLNVSRA